jgi:hypothetical protein
MYFPSVCVDNFFNNPDQVREHALALDFHSTDNNPWPGKRTQSLHSISKEYFDIFCNKLFSLTFDLKKYNTIVWSVDTYFQIIEPQTYGDINQGWIHRDDDATIYAGIIYLTPNIDINCGTSLFKPKGMCANPINATDKRDMFLNFDKNNTNYLAQKLEENNSQFVETTRFNNVYNRLVAYDGAQYHGVNQFTGTDTQPRLTQVFFVKEISSPWFPVPASKQVQL